MASDWVGIAETTIKEYIRDTEDDILRNFKWSALLQAKGRVTYNHGGTDMDWKIKYRRGTPKGYADMDTVTFPRRNRHKTATLGWRGYNFPESISKLDRLKNKGNEAIVKIFDDKTSMMMEDFEEFFGTQIYIDGNATGNTKLFHGVESTLSTSGASAGNKIGLPNDTYAGITTGLGDYGGSWTGTWPNGTGPVEYDFFSPLLVDVTNTGWDAATKTWPNTCMEAMRFAVIQGMRNKSKRGFIDMVTLDRDYYTQFVNRLSDKERIQVDRGAGGKPTLVSLGFGDVVNFEGCEVTTEYGVPATTGYGFNTNMIELRSMQGQLFVSEGPFEHEEDKSLRWAIDCFGNFRLFPRQLVKFYPYT